VEVESAYWNGIPTLLLGRFTDSLYRLDFALSLSHNRCQARS
jgi:hypothetical protein